MTQLVSYLLVHSTVTLRYTGSRLHFASVDAAISHEHRRLSTFVRVRGVTLRAQIPTILNLWHKLIIVLNKSRFGLLCANYIVR